MAGLEDTAARHRLRSRPPGSLGGDVWLQRALDDTSQCFAINNTYYAFINPKDGIENNQFVSFDVPWWSKSTDSSLNADKYVEWWRSARIYIFDDQDALNDLYLPCNGTLPGDTCKEAQLAGPVLECNKSIAKNSCISNQLKIYKVPDSSAALFAPKTPVQLNEITFADIGDASSNYLFISRNVNYNVSYVDQLYLPLAIEPIRPKKDYGYNGTTMGVDNFRTALTTFSGANGENWPVYAKPANRYPNSGIRLPSALAAFNFYMNPNADIIPVSPPPLLQNVVTNWQNCTAAMPVDCPQSALYQPINQAFINSYKFWVGNSVCTQDPSFMSFLKPNADGTMPANQYAYLRYIHGWVPFNNGCSVPDLPKAIQPPNQLGIAPINYIELQYNWQTTSMKSQWFNPYAEFIHNELKANSYAFSIDDSSSVVNTDASGLIFAVGGPNGLENPNQFPPPLPNFYQWYTFSVTLGAGAPGWKSYQLCKENPEVLFPPVASGPNAGRGWGMNPALYNFPCTINLTTNGANPRKFQFTILQPGIPPAAIWGPNPNGNGKTADPAVVSCPNPLKRPLDWCHQMNENSTPSTDDTIPPVYNLIGASPNVPR